jgi:hypothetical protein
MKNQQGQVAAPTVTAKPGESHGQALRQKVRMIFVLFRSILPFPLPFHGYD